ncbi:peptidoglycan DD-metalloendopeptidase family protein [Rhodococcus sp. NPDC059968]|uniref:peptidoglycan DD-metalloendopeptidase family protein n=1 Tax=Rhodococcus sp. NPDC059968 TaxID=3347017 RepID=UPI00366D7670
MSFELGDHVWYWNGKISFETDIPRKEWFGHLPGFEPDNPIDYRGYGKEIFNFVIHADEIARGRPQMTNFEGSFAWLNNNPGNITGHPNGTDFGQYPGKFNWHNFLIFPTWASGYDAIAKLLRTNLYATKSILDAFKIYAPASDGNDPVTYANAVGVALGVPVSTRVGDLDEEQMLVMQDKIQEIEGVIPGASLSWDSDEIPVVIAELLPTFVRKYSRPRALLQPRSPFTVEVTAPVGVPGFTQGYGGPNQGGHVGPSWYIQYGMDIGGAEGTPVYAAFDGHVTKFQPHNPAADSGRVYGAQIFMRSPNDVMGGFYTHLTDVADGLGVGSGVAVGEFLGRIHKFGGISPHLHLALVEIIGGAPDGQYQGIDLYQFFLSLQTNNPEAFVPVQFWQDGRPPEPQFRSARFGVLRSNDSRISNAQPQKDPQKEPQKDPHGEPRNLATLVLETLKCEATDDTGSDEPYITINEDEVWRASDVDAGDIRSIDIRHSFDNIARLELLDGEVGADSEIGSKIIESAEASSGLRRAYMNNGSALYIVEYHVE